MRDQSAQRWHRLLDRLEADLERTDDITAASRRPVELDQSKVGRLSRMDALQGHAMQSALAARRAGLKGRIQQARARLAEEEFGYCVKCGDEIAEKRLALDPTVAVCIKCAL